MSASTLPVPIVSVTMPVYNGAGLVKQTVQSIQAQTFKEWELIAVDDGSSDDSWEVLQEIASAEPRLRAIRLENNQGHRAASNRAFSLAQGKYVARTDQDDLSEPDRLARQVEFLDRHPDVGLVASGHYRLYPDGRRVAIRKTRDPISVRWGLLFNNVYCHSSFMFRRDFVKGPNAYRFAPSAYDYEVCARLAWETEIAAIPDPLVSYRIHDSGLASTDTDNMVTAALAISSREIRRLLRPDRLERTQFWAIRRLATGFDVSGEDMKHLPLLFNLMRRFQGETGATNGQMTRIWRRILRRLIAKLPIRDQALLIRQDPVGAMDGLLSAANKQVTRPLRLGFRGLKRLVGSR